MSSDFKRPRDTIEILGPWLMNKGDELMLRSVGQRLGAKYVLAASTSLYCAGQKDLPEILDLKFRPSFHEFRLALQNPSLETMLSLAKRSVGLAALPEHTLRARGIRDSRSLAALLDCSGFAYGDQWTPRRIISRTEYYEKLHKQGVKLLMLPQALGPFENPDIREHAKRLLSLFDFIFPRDQASARHVLKLGIDAAKVEVCPDISHLLDPPPVDDPALWRRRVAIVPNTRLLDKTDSATSEGYLDFLVTCVQRVYANDLEPVVLVHETNDDSLVDTLLSKLEKQPRVYDEDGLTSKGFLRHCYANIGSRYHSLVSSFSQATPTLGTSWAHKYETLFAEYGCESCLLSPALSKEETAQQIDSFLSADRNRQLRDTLRLHAQQQRQKVEAMWERVEKIIRDSGT